ncbi:RNA polymerase sigma factor [Aristaeella hokkaidonensis]|uniref:RNA polymerase sigma factor n=1 Tax=Aristaeella hokkaidonensis TaxID=3046382 RepID=A0AC61N653_9FIRM|nr:RNA polymerase sigma factor [Aristaeella hokkaidonensis]QUC66528.1 RNA polymerase sigma factor [Aristaeella hokkaidonensis]SNT94052.1 RNA polymerase, sigma-24 subunit, RpoE [Aristaeella hokkaidonensis]
MDELLLRKAQHGDPEAFEQLITPLEQLIWRICWHYTGNRESAEDCGQETMIRIWRSLDSYRGDCALESWVYRIAANCCMDYLRKKKRDKSVSMEPMQEQGFDPADPSPGTEEQVVAADEQKRLREAITLLPEDQREALIMTQLEKVPYEEAAKLLGVSEGTIKSRVNRAKARLKEILSGERELSPPGNVKIDERRSRS